MTIRLGRVLPKVLALSQSGFVPGRLLSDNVLLEQELIHSLESRRPNANVIFKLDMAKAYDRYAPGMGMTNLSHGGWLALIKSVLQAMPLHLLQVISPSKSILLAIERIFNGFFWGSYNGRKHIHWTSWAKFGTGYVAFEKWRSHLYFGLWATGGFFWHDNWFGEKTLAKLVNRESYTMEPVRYYWHEGEWNVPKIFRTVPTHIAQVICQILIAAGQDEKIVWTRSSDGVFSMREAWETIRVASPRRQLLADIRHCSLRPTMSVFFWRLFQNRIPVDARMKQKGLASRPNANAVRQKRRSHTYLWRARQCMVCGSILPISLGFSYVTPGTSFIWCIFGATALRFTQTCIFVH
ncbi:UNVERIFIED_CONTAM: hypothetical protein Slati_2933000 [Sesamum latifolium]|uniref:Reverse transcriptase zinc-binding domain-containing protein n=1 Tax=Sesamum latifolium TaxID=2727402 RepID=A0AAW2VEE6_9LAMI